MVSVPENVPAELIAGDTWQWTRELSEYPAGTWTITYYFENKDQVFNAAASAVGTIHSVTIAAATTLGYKPGRYRWRARAESGGVKKTVESGWLEVQVDPAAAGTKDVRTQARRTLDAVEATLEGRASSDQLAMTLNGRSISRTPLRELREWRDQLRAEVRIEEQGSNAGLGRNIGVRFNRV